jgi:hypothetical protein
LVKEADALAEAGFDVTVICAFWADWARKTDRNLLASRSWSRTYVGGDPESAPIPYHWTKFRHGIARRLVGRTGGFQFLECWAACRVLPELVNAARNTPADLYVAHNLGALPAAVAAARANEASAGFDVEDLHSAMVPEAEMTAADLRAANIETAWLPHCDYLTAASPGIAEAYSARYGLSLPTTILNVFPLAQRPSERRHGNPDGPLTLYWFSQTIGAGEGLEDVVAAMGLLKDKALELHLRGVWASGYADRLLRLAVSVGIDPARIIHHPPEPPEEMVRLAAAYDVGLSLQIPTCINHDICLTNKLFTYILAGNAVVATATEGQRPILEKIGNAGAGYQPGDVHTLANCLNTWVRDRDALEAARRQAWACGTQVYNWDIEKAKFLNVVDRTLARSSQAKETIRTS